MVDSLLSLAVHGGGVYRYEGRSGAAGDWFVVGLAVQKHHLSLHVNAAEDGENLGRRYAARLGKVMAGSASLTFKRGDDVDLAVLAELAARARDLVASGSAES